MLTEQELANEKKLTILADWFDVYDNERAYTGPREVQDDLRRIAADLRAMSRVVEAAEPFRATFTETGYTLPIVTVRQYAKLTQALAALKGTP